MIIKANRQQIAYHSLVVTEIGTCDIVKIVLFSKKMSDMVYFMPKRRRQTL